ncbi:MAG: hypothetical protein JXA89_05440 [Anaerolineae bacterium]|nr:hypothetical protein [Anaerolineae bacterium]
MTQDIAHAFFPMNLPGGVTGRLVDGETAQQAIEAIGAQIFPSRETIGLFVTPRARRGRLAPKEIQD